MLGTPWLKNRPLGSVGISGQSGSSGRFDQILHLTTEVIEITEPAVDGRKADVSDLVEVLQFPQDRFADGSGGNLGRTHGHEVSLDPL